MHDLRFDMHGSTAVQDIATPSLQCWSILLVKQYHVSALTTSCFQLNLHWGMFQCSFIYFTIFHGPGGKGSPWEEDTFTVILRDMPLRFFLAEQSESTACRSISGSNTATDMVISSNWPQRPGMMLIHNEKHACFLSP
jgi:hypothetical protein